MKRLHVVLAVILIASTLIAVVFAVSVMPTAPKEYTNFVGVTYCGETVEAGKLLIDKVKEYTNLFVLQSGTLQRNLASVEQLGDYAISKGLYFLPYFGLYIQPSFFGWVENMKQKWGTRFLGVYYDDERGGRMLDSDVDLGKDPTTGDSIMKTRYGDVKVEKPNGVVIHYEINGLIHVLEPASSLDNIIINRTEITDVYATFYPNGTISVERFGTPATQPSPVFNWSTSLTYNELMSEQPLKDPTAIAARFYANNQENIQSIRNLTKVFTSDYALYWFDYLTGYDVILAQLGWNISLSQQIGLIRGAATMQNKDWGAVISWKYDNPPYLDSGIEIFSQMRTAYESGAKYIILFNYYESEENPYGTLKDEHFDALHDFWSKVLKNPDEIIGSTKAEGAFVLPMNYACGLRWKQDKNWGVLEPNAQSNQVWDSLQKALVNNDFRLDIVYDDSRFPVAERYQQVTSWNQTS